jgi:hypothetical protein
LDTGNFSLPFAVTPVNEKYREYSSHNIKYEELSRRLNVVKKEFGLRRAVSSRSLTGETRTFAEILDQEVEKIVLFYLSVQGDIAKRAWDVRSYQLENTFHLSLSVDNIGKLAFQYRELARDILDLLNFLDRNTINLKKLIKRHDQLFDQKLGSMYFNTRMGSGGSKNYQLIQLYQQEGVQAIIGTIRRGFEELYDAKAALTGVEMTNENVTSRGRSQTGGSSVPRISYKNKLASFSNLASLASLEDGRGATASDHLLEDSKGRSKSASHLSQLIDSSAVAATAADHNRHRSATTLSSGLSLFKRPISELEPILKQIDDAAERVTVSQSQSTAGYLVTHSELALDVSEDEEEDEEVELN